MSDICPKCGLNKELCVCETIAKEGEKIRVYSVKRRFGKLTTLVEGISKESNNKQVLRELKTGLACGGTIKGGVIELQGDHKNKVGEILIKIGFSADQIEVS